MGKERASATELIKIGKGLGNDIFSDLEICTICYYRSICIEMLHSLNERLIMRAFFLLSWIKLQIFCSLNSTRKKYRLASKCILCSRVIHLSQLELSSC